MVALWAVPAFAGGDEQPVCRTAQVRVFPLLLPVVEVVYLPGGPGWGDAFGFVDAVIGFLSLAYVPSPFLGCAVGGPFVVVGPASDGAGGYFVVVGEHAGFDEPGGVVGYRPGVSAPVSSGHGFFSQLRVGVLVLGGLACCVLWFLVRGRGFVVGVRRRFGLGSVARCRCRSAMKNKGGW